jgi:uncharacterized protein
MTSSAHKHSDESGAVAQLQLLDWKRRVFDLYRDVRSSADPEKAWVRWCEERNELFATHSQSPLPEQQQTHFAGLDLFGYDPGCRVTAQVIPAEGRHYDILTSTGSSYGFTHFATATFELASKERRLELYWLDGYGGGVLLPFRDAGSGKVTYGGGRYLLDSVKGADLGMQDGGLVLDFNFAYNPSCYYDPLWTCPLATPANRLDIVVAAGEKATVELHQSART